MKLTSLLSLPIVAFLLSAECADAQWVRTNGPFGGSVNSFAVIGENGSSPIIFAGTPLGGVYRSMDSGTSWNAVNTGLTNLSVNALATMGSNVFAGTNDGAFLSTDSGAHWAAVNTGLTDTRILRFTVSGPNLFASTNEPGCSVTTNNGDTWTPVTAGFGDSLSVRAFAASGSDLYALAYNGSTALSAISFSSDYGLNWRPIDTRGQLSIENLIVRKGELIALTYFSGGIARSSDSGATWVEIGSAPHSNSIFSLIMLGNDLIEGSDEGVFRSRDSGATWSQLNLGAYRNAPVFELATIGTSILAGTENRGALKSTDSGNTWTSINEGLTNATITALASTGTSLIVGTLDSGGLRSTDRGSSWNEWNKDFARAQLHGLLIRKNDILAGTDSGVFRSADDGSTWNMISAFNHIGPLASTDSSLLGGTGWNAKVVRSRDDGGSWSEVFTREVYSVASLASIGENICAATLPGPAFISNDDGTSWHEGVGLLGVSVGSATVSLGSKFFLATDRGIFRSADSGMTWVPVNTGLTDTTVTALATSGKNLFVGTQRGEVFMSANDGDDWTSVRTGLTPAQITYLAADDANLFAGTSGASLWRRPLLEMTPSAVSTTSQPSTFKLNQNYPNPFNPSTTITFTLPDRSEVTLDIFDMLGRKVQTLANGWMDAGPHRATFDGADLGSGVYSARLAGNGLRREIRMMLCK